MDQEEWRAVPGYEGRYEVSNLGRVRSLFYGLDDIRILKPYHDPYYGYVHMVFTVNNKSRTHLLHRLVAQAFLPNPDKLPEVNHKKGIKSKNAAADLEWCTRQQNAQHAYDTGLIPRMKNMPKGEKHHASKLTADDVREIRAIYASGAMGAHRLGKKFGVTKQAINAIRWGKTWKHI